MREVAVDLGDQLGAVGERAAEAGDVRRPEPLLALAVEDVDEGELPREPVGLGARAVRRGVVDHEHAAVEPVRRRARLPSARTIGSRFSRSL